VIWGPIIDQWITDAYISKGASTETAGLRRAYLQRLARDVDGNLWELDGDALTAWISHQGSAANTRICARASVRSFYQWAQKRGHIGANPADDIPKPKTPQPRPRPVPNDVYASVVASTRDPRIRVALRLAGELGLRRAEVAALHREHLIEDEDGYWLRFVGKGNKERTIPCPPDIADEVLALIADTPGEYAFPAVMGRPGTGQIYRPEAHLTPHWLGTLVSRVLPDGYTMHKLRHRAGTEAYRRSGNDIYLASKLLGHSSVVTTQVYVKPDLSRLRAVVTGTA
jgi:integrase